MCPFLAATIAPMLPPTLVSTLRYVDDVPYSVRTELLDSSVASEEKDRVGLCVESVEDIPSWNTVIRQ